MIAPAHFSASLPTGRVKTAAADRASTSRLEALYDAELVRRFKAGDETAFVEITTRYRERMFSVAMAMLKNHGDAEEIAQDTFIRAHRALANFRGDSSLATWLHRIALNLSRNRYWYFFRRQRHATQSLDNPLNGESQATFADCVAANDLGPVRETMTREFSELVVKCVAKLGASHREILALCNTLHHSYAEIASELGISVGTVKSRIARARDRLRLLLTQACPDFGEDARPTEWFEAIRPRGGVEALCA